MIIKKYAVTLRLCVGVKNKFSDVNVCTRVESAVK